MQKLHSKKYGSLEYYKGKQNLLVLWIAFFIVFPILLIIILLMVLNGVEVQHRPISNACKPIACAVASELPENEDIKLEVTEVDDIATNSTLWQGKVSHYSREGCLGCSETLTMANGQPLDDNAMTIAFNHLPMNTKVRITNLDNGKSVIATVTDTGGFERLGRIADLVPAVKNALETKTDQSEVLIEQL